MHSLQHQLETWNALSCISGDLATESLHGFDQWLTSTSLPIAAECEAWETTASVGTVGIVAVVVTRVSPLDTLVHICVYST